MDWINYLTLFLFITFFLFGIINLKYVIYEICKRTGVFYVIPKKNYFNELIKLIKSLKGKILYVSLANSSIKIINTLLKNKINKNNLFFLDIKSDDKEINKIKNNGINNIKKTSLKDLMSLMGIYLKEKKFDYLIIDNINSLRMKDSKSFNFIKRT
ncbi:hypothetical protein J4404_01915, partial [Candidatus Woesearchaeota archaeon]|nr:hypothetical protein [Candidatus Woesearchaeota archaeon]